MANIPESTALVQCFGNRITVRASDKKTLSDFSAMLSKVCTLTDLKFNAWDRFWQAKMIDRLWSSRAYEKTEAYMLYLTLKAAGMKTGELTKKDFTRWFRQMDIGAKNNTVIVFKKRNRNWSEKFTIFKLYHDKTITKENAYNITHQIARVTMSAEGYAQFCHDDRF